MALKVLKGRRGVCHIKIGSLIGMYNNKYPNERVLVCGGRDFHKIKIAYNILDVVEPKHIISGGAAGADSLAEKYAKENYIPITIYPANWPKYGKGAGPIRNKQMLEEGKPTMVVALSGGKGY